MAALPRFRRITMSRLSRRDLLKIGGVAGAGALIGVELPELFQSANASVQASQTALPGGGITRFTTPLPTFAGQRVSATSLQVGMAEFQQKVLPDSFYTSLAAPLRHGTYLWGYAVGQSGAHPRPQFPGVTIEATRGTPITATY